MTPVAPCTLAARCTWLRGQLEALPSLTTATREAGGWVAVRTRRKKTLDVVCDLTGAANAVLATNVSLQPMQGNDVSRELELTTLGPQPTVPVEVHAQISFEVELAPSGVAGTAPAWGPLLRACAVAETISAGVSVTYNPVSDAHESATLHFWIENTRFALVGARGTAKVSVEAQKVPKIAFTFTGLFTAPAETAQATPVLGAWPSMARTRNGRGRVT